MGAAVTAGVAGVAGAAGVATGTGASGTSAASSVFFTKSYTKWKVELSIASTMISTSSWFVCA